MSLATRCKACGTVFRVVQDQLKVSEGWVRCGRCNEVFSALEGLFDLERDTPPDWSVGVPASAEALPATPDVVIPPFDGAADHTPDEEEGHPLIDKIDAQLMGSWESAHDSTPATRINERDRLEFPDAQFDPEMLVDDTAYPQTTVAETPWATASDGGPVADSPASPAFVEQSRRRERWRSPGVRAVSALTGFALLVALALQAAHHFRHTIAAHWPGAGPSLATWCAAMSCTIEAPRRIEDVSVESTALARAPMPDAFRLSVVLRNHGAAVVALPSVDLSLTDANGQLVARRVLAPRDFRAAPAPIKPGGESALQLLLAVGGARVTGYTVEVFYP